MALSAPTTFPVVSLDEIAAGRDLYASTLRRLAEQQVYLYTYGQKVLSAWGSSWNFSATDELARLRPNGSATAEDGPINIGTFMVPPGQSLAWLRVHVKYGSGSPGSSSPSGFMQFHVMPPAGSDGQEYAQKLVLASTTSELATAEGSLEAPAPGSTVVVTLHLDNPSDASTVYLVAHSISAWFKPPTAGELGISALPAGAVDFEPLTQIGIEGGHPASAHILRTLWEWHTRLWAYCVRPAFHHSWEKNWTDSTTTPAKARYRMHNPDWGGTSYPANTAQATFRVGCRATQNGAGGTAWNASLYVNGVLAKSTGFQTASSDVKFVEVTINTDSGGASNIGPSNTDVDVELRVETAENGKRVDLVSFSYWYADPFVKCAFDETVPASFSWLPFDVIKNGTPLHEVADVLGRKVGLESLVGNMLYLRKRRTSLGGISDWLYRWQPFGSYNPNPRAYYSLGDQIDDSLAPGYAVPWEDSYTSHNRNQSRLRLPCAEDPDDRRIYHYWVAVSDGLVAKYRQQSYRAPIRFRLRHGAWNQAEQTHGQMAGAIKRELRPNVLWLGPFESGSEVLSPRTAPALSVYRMNKASDYAPIVCGSLIMGAPLTK